MKMNSVIKYIKKLKLKLFIEFHVFTLHQNSFLYNMNLDINVMGNGKCEI